MQPLQLAFYKGMGGKHGAVQFNLQRPHFYCTKCKTRDYNSDYPNKSQACKSGNGLRRNE
jgi:hypothetical protein